MISKMDSLYENIDESLENEFRHQALINLLLPKLKGRRIIDIGCGSGIFLKEALLRGYDAYGIDDSLSQCRLTRKRLKEANFTSNRVKCISLQTLKKLNIMYDSIVCLDVIEHIRNDRSATKSLVDILRPGGVLVIAVPALPALWSKRDQAYGHFRRYAKKDLLRVLDTKLLKTTKIRYWNFIGALLAWLIILMGIEMRMDHLATNQKFPMNLINGFLKFWLNNVEKFNIFPIGLTLISISRKQPD